MQYDVSYMSINLHLKIRLAFIESVSIVWTPTLHSLNSKISVTEFEMANNVNSHKHYQKNAIVVALALVIAATSFSQYLPAANASSAAISAMPPVSPHDKGTSVYLQIRFASDTANPIQKIRVVVDNTPNP